MNLDSEKIQELLRHFRAVTVIEHDADIESATLRQAMLIVVGIPNLEVTRTDEMITAANAVALKLKGLRYHAKRFQMLQTQRLEQISGDNEALKAYRRNVNLCEHQMLYEFEGFCFQFKSSLDMLAKILGWPQRELRALAQKQSESQKVILPIWHDVTVEEVRDHFLLLADVVALKWGDGIQTVVNRLLEVIKGGGSPRLVEDRNAQFLERATISPRRAITEKWNELTEAILNAGMRSEALIKSTENRNPSEIVNVLFSTKLLDESDKETFFSLKKWHFGINLDRSGPMEPQDAVTFSELADQLKAKLAST